MESEMTDTVKQIFFLIIILISATVFAKSEIEIKDDIIKVRASGICYLDEGITTEQSRLLSKYDALNEALNDIGSFLEANDSLVIFPMKKMSYVKYLSNQLDILVYHEGKESIDGYPSYLTDISASIHINQLKDVLFRVRTDNKFRYLLQVEYERFKSLTKELGFLKSSTNKIPDNFISDIITRLTATDWANKAHLTPEEGLKIEYYSIAVDLDQNYESSYIFLTESMIKAGQYSLVMGVLNKLINHDPLKFPAAYAIRGYIYSMDRQYAAAIKELEKSLAIEPSFTYSYCILGSILSDLRKLDEALEKYATSIETDPDYYLSYLYRGNLYRKNGKYDEALVDYNKVIELNPKNIESYYNSGIIYYLTGIYNKAAEQYSKALYLNELSSALYYNRGIAYRKVGNNEKAIEDYKTYLLLTVKDIDESNTENLISAWMEEVNFNPIFME